jgi:tartrate/fumarate subfamily iron-sulfur-dependent hydro-lyase alpha chain
VRTISEEDLVASIGDALQFISHYHPADYVRNLAAAWRAEESPAARDAMGQILANSRMAALGRRPLCQDTGVAHVFMKVGVGARIATTRSLQDLADEAVRRAWAVEANPLRASVVADPLFARRNTGDNTPAILHVELVAGDLVEVHVAAKGGGSENKSRYANLNPGDRVADWVVRTVDALGAGWCPPGLLGIGVGGSPEKAMLLAKEALLEPIDMPELRARGPANPLEEMRIELWERVNALGIGAQGLGGLTTVLDVKIRTLPVHAASLRSGSCRNAPPTAISTSPWTGPARRVSRRPPPTSGRTSLSARRRPPARSISAGSAARRSRHGGQARPCSSRDGCSRLGTPRTDASRTCWRAASRCPSICATGRSTMSGRWTPWRAKPSGRPARPRPAAWTRSWSRCSPKPGSS